MSSPALAFRSVPGYSGAPVLDAGPSFNRILAMTDDAHNNATDTDNDAPGRDDDTQPAPEQSFPVVGIGASAGGLEALKELFGEMPADTGAAFVVISHQHPDHVSMLPQLLGKTTDMLVTKVKDGAKLAPNHVYVAAGVPVTVKDNTLREEHIEERHTPPLLVDLFFRSLAEDRQHLAICIVLSGTGADGTLGLKAVKGAGGMAIVQEARTARYAGMPSSAIATSQADYVLPPARMPGRLAAYFENMTVPKLPSEQGDGEPLPNGPMRELFRLIRTRTKHDFSQYKLSTLRRRIERRINVHQLNSLEDYVRFLHDNPQEIDILSKEFLIGVTSFFRDSESFRALAEGPLAGLVEEKDDDAQFRAWVVGCGTGEEAYSLAILLHEQTEQAHKAFDIQVFATDLDEDAIQIARAGRYPSGIVNDVPADKLQRYFAKEDTSYRISKDIRDMVVFAPHDVASDPPFTRLDLISCRNVLIYMTSDLQKRLLPIFHYALRSGGLLFLGPSETVGVQDALFESLEKRHKVYRRREVPSDLPQLPSVTTPRPDAAVAQSANGEEDATRTARRHKLSAIAERMLLNRFAPPSVLTNASGDVFYIHGRTGKYLEPAGGEPPGNVTEMAREGLRERLGPALYQAAGEDGHVVRSRVRVKTNGEWAYIDLSVAKLSEPESLKGMMLITMRPAAPPPEPDENGEAKEKHAGEEDAETPSPKDPRIAELEQELRYTKESLQSTVEELETSNEELKSTNEELQSTNEELQSANEELETSKEEMQSLNEELTTVNNELEAKVEELAEANSDMQNLLNSTEIATLFLDSRLRIKRFTKKAKEVISLIETDIGRPIADLATNITGIDLEQKANTVLDSLTQIEEEIQAEDGNWYLLRMSPYRTTENVIDGVVVTFVEISQVKGVADEGQRAWEYYESIFDTLREPVLVLDKERTVVTANDRFYSTFRIGPKYVEGRKISEIGKGQWNLAELRDLLDTVLPENNTFQDYELEADFGRAGRRKLLLNGRKVQRAAGLPEMILLAMEDVTEDG